MTSVIKRDWLQYFKNKEGLGGVICEGPEVTAACNEIRRLSTLTESLTARLEALSTAVKPILRYWKAQSHGLTDTARKNWHLWCGAGEEHVTAEHLDRLTRLCNEEDVEEKPSWEEIGAMTEEIRNLGLLLAAAEGKISGLTGAMKENYDEYQFFRQQLKEEKGQLEVKLVAAELEQGRLKAAIQACLNHANNRESEWGSRAEESFAFLYAALETPEEKKNAQNIL